MVHGYYAAKNRVNRNTVNTKYRIIQALEEVGATVYSVMIPGLTTQNVFVAGFGRQNRLLVIKSPDRNLTPTQINIINNWKGRDISVVDSVQTALEAIDS